MKILRYAFRDWPGQFDGTVLETELGTFDFLTQHVWDVLLQEKHEQEQRLHISGSRRATYAQLLKLLDWVKQQMDNASEVAIWHHPTRDLPIEELQKENGRASEESRKASGSNIQNAITHPDHYEDEFFGIYLWDLIYDRKFESCFCPKCQQSYAAPDCGLEQWYADSSGGQKLVCSRGHTLHARHTIEYFMAPSK